METARLRDLNIGESARVVGFAPTHRSYRSKLLSMGLTKGTLITVRNVAPLGDPVHITVRDFELSLRRDEAETLVLERVDSGAQGACCRERRRFGRFGGGKGRRGFGRRKRLSDEVNRG
jgi:ferrous iron transport protein A